ncbi:MAG TPA: hypothetical protein VJR71_07795 [Pseudolabrys sp.]|nr:hypothetical protein [Pseudolabrys sp.]
MRAFLARALVVGMMAVAVLAAMTAAAAAQSGRRALFACAGPASARPVVCRKMDADPGPCGGRKSGHRGAGATALDCHKAAEMAG